MPNYTAPLRDMRFVLYEVLGGDDLVTLPGCEDFSADVVENVLEEAAKICQEVLQPLNRSGDEEGCHYENGVVRTPAGFKNAYNLFREGGWTATASDPHYGGQGLPKSINIMIEEMICSANVSFSLFAGLTHGAYISLKEFGSDELKDTYLPKMVAGIWSGTMCLTEPHCGTDLGLMRTKATPESDGSYKITGNKMFISAGEHDLTENIIHLVLARLPDAPPGIKGISLFVVPKFLVNKDGSLGARNGVKCGAIEHKMGIKASPTCVMNFDAATGFLVGSPHKGMAAMFAMMNAERLSVGTQGLALAEAAYQGARDYARDRVQGRALRGAKYPDKPADPIIVHPDIRRMLLTQRAYIEGSRALAVWVSKTYDHSKRHPDAQARQEAEDRVALMTPVVKALLTDLGFESTNLAMQVYGGHGFIRENGMEQFVRDSRIAQIYEGTNGIQALDLVGRKLPAHYGRYLRSVFHPISDYIETHSADAELGELIKPLARAFGKLQKSTGYIAQSGLANPDEAGAAATDYLRLLGLTVLGYLWVRMAEASLAHIAKDNTGFYQAKLSTARFFLHRLLPQTDSLAAAIVSGSRTMMEFPEDAF